MNHNAATHDVLSAEQRHRLSPVHSLHGWTSKISQVVRQLAHRERTGWIVVTACAVSTALTATHRPLVHVPAMSLPISKSSQIHINHCGIAAHLGDRHSP